MMQSLIIGLWACFVSLGATFGGVYMRTHASASAEATHEEKMDIRKIRPITVPIISDGVLKGYVSAEFNIVGPKGDGHGKGLDPESFIMDEAFKLIYAESKIDFTQIKKADLTALTNEITANVNQRLGHMVIKETLIKNITFVSRDDMPH
jgi:hypothetical protein